MPATPDVAGDRRDAWVKRVQQFVREVKAWAEGEGWSTHETVKEIREYGIGEYEAAYLRVRLPEGEVHVTPIALDLARGRGRIDLESFPNLNRVKLIGNDEGEEWAIITDSGVPLRRPWSRETFVQLARDLTANP